MNAKTENKIGFTETENGEKLFINVNGFYIQEHYESNGVFIFDSKNCDKALIAIVKVFKKIETVAKKRKINFEYTLKFDGNRIDILTKNLSANWACGAY